jgi:hypothetical protein
VENPDRNAKMSERVQTTSRASATNPDSAKTSGSRIQARRTSARRAVAAAGAVAPAASAAGRNQGASASAASAIRRFAATAAYVVPRTPSCAMRKKPVTKQPATAPSVFPAYRAPILRPSASPRPTTACASSGSVAPIRIVGTSTIAKQIAKRTIANSSDPDPRLR